MKKCSKYTAVQVCLLSKNYNLQLQYLYLYTVCGSGVHSEVGERKLERV